MSDFLQRSDQNAKAYFAKYRDRLRGYPIRAIFIGCVDSRVVPELLLGVEPGEMMTLRVPGGLVPPQGVGESAVSSKLELALHRVDTIRDVIVCGHTNCLLLHQLGEGVDSFQEPNLARWVAMSEFIRAEASTTADKHNDPDGFAQALLEHSVRRSLINMRELPIVRAKEEAGQITLHGWYFDLDTGDLMAYDASADRFVPLAEYHPTPSLTTESYKAGMTSPATRFSATDTAPAPSYVSRIRTKQAGVAGTVGATGVTAWSKHQEARARRSRSLRERYVLDPNAPIGDAPSVSADIPSETPFAPESVAPQSVAPPTVAPTSIAPDEVVVSPVTSEDMTGIPSVSPQSVEPGTVAPAPVNVPRGEPVQRVYASEVSPKPQMKATPPVPTSLQGEIQAEVDEDELVQAEAPAPRQIPIPANVAKAMEDPALDDLKQVLEKMKFPAGRQQAKQALNKINSPQGWRDVARAVHELRDPQVRQALREVAFEIRSPQARAELRKIIANMDAGTSAQTLAHLTPDQIRSEFDDLIKRLRSEK
jgi:carbonic anhydrase